MEVVKRSVDLDHMFSLNTFILMFTKIRLPFGPPLASMMVEGLKYKLISEANRVSRNA